MYWSIFHSSYFCNDYNIVVNKKGNKNLTAVFKCNNMLSRLFVFACIRTYYIW